MLQACNKISYPSGTFFLCAVFYYNHMCDKSLLLASTSGTTPPQGPSLWKIYVIMSSKQANANKDVEIPVAEGVQETNPKDLDAELLEDLVPEDSETDLLQLGGYSDHREELPWKAEVKDDHSNTRKDG